MLICTDATQIKKRPDISKGQWTKHCSRWNGRRQSSTWTTRCLREKPQIALNHLRLELTLLQNAGVILKLMKDISPWCPSSIRVILYTRTDGDHKDSYEGNKRRTGTHRSERSAMRFRSLQRFSTMCAKLFAYCLLFRQETLKRPRKGFLRSSNKREEIGRKTKRNCNNGWYSYWQMLQGHYTLNKAGCNTPVGLWIRQQWTDGPDRSTCYWSLAFNDSSNKLVTTHKESFATLLAMELLGFTFSKVGLQVWVFMKSSSGS